MSDSYRGRDGAIAINLIALELDVKDSTENSYTKKRFLSFGYRLTIVDCLRRYSVD